jgi:GNAT superfamily N-acetyltransferase
LGKRKNLTKKVLLLFEDCFVNLNNIMKKWVSNYTTLVMMNEENVVAAVTYNKKKYKGVKYVDLLLVGVDSSYRMLGYGKKIVELITKDNKVLAWADEAAMTFYEKIKFTFYSTPKNHKKLINYMTDSRFVGKGFSGIETSLIFE